MRNFARNRGKEGVAQLSAQDKANRQHHAANAKVSVARTALSHNEHLHLHSQPHRQNYGNNNAPVQPPWSDQKLDVWGTDLSNADISTDISTEHRSVIQVKNSQNYQDTGDHLEEEQVNVLNEEEAAEASESNSSDDPEEGHSSRLDNQLAARNRHLQQQSLHGLSVEDLHLVMGSAEESERHSRGMFDNTTLPSSSSGVLNAHDEFDHEHHNRIDLTDINDGGRSSPSQQDPRAKGQRIHQSTPGSSQVYPNIQWNSKVASKQCQNLHHSAHGRAGSRPNFNQAGVDPISTLQTSHRPANATLQIRGPGANQREPLYNEYVPQHGVHQSAKAAQFPRDSKIEIPPYSEAPVIQQNKGRIDEERTAVGFIEDYDLDELFTMDYEKLKNEDFDTVPRGHPAVLSEDMVQRPLEERLFYVQQSLDATDQAKFFNSLPTHEWEDAGDWFIEKFSSIIKRTKETRQTKRKLAQNFEDEVEKRHRHVAKKQHRVKDALEQMRNRGQGLVPKSPARDK